MRIKTKKNERVSVKVDTLVSRKRKIFPIWRINKLAVPVPELFPTRVLVHVLCGVRAERYRVGQSPRLQVGLAVTRQAGRLVQREIIITSKDPT